MYLPGRPYGICPWLDLLSRTRKPDSWNPSKNEFLTLPIPGKSWSGSTAFLGYDPVEDKHKVMCMPLYTSSEVCMVLTLGSGQKSWRSVETIHKHCTEYGTSGRCIKGVIYYVGFIPETRVWVVMSFDVRSEKFDRINLPSDIFTDRPATIYHGRLAYVEKSNTRRLWILEDAEKHKWSSQVFLSHFVHYDERLQTTFTVVGFTHAGEFVFAPLLFSKRSYVLFWDPVRNSCRRFEFKGITDGERFVGGMFQGLVFPNHIER